jgi:hypothetical protein
MDESINVVLCNSLCNTFGSFHMNILKIKVPRAVSILPDMLGPSHVLGGVHAPDEVVYNVGMSHALFEGLGVPKVIFLIGKSAEFPRVALSPRTMNITLPKSPETFRCRFAISSRNGTMTVHPWLAIPSPCNQSNCHPNAARETLPSLLTI